MEFIYLILMIRDIIYFQPMFIVASTLMDLVKNLKSFAGILVVRFKTILIPNQSCLHIHHSWLK